MWGTQKKENSYWLVVDTNISMRHFIDDIYEKCFRKMEWTMRASRQRESAVTDSWEKCYRHLFHASFSAIIETCSQQRQKCPTSARRWGAHWYWLFPRYALCRCAPSIDGFLWDMPLLIRLIFRGAHYELLDSMKPRKRWFDVHCLRAELFSLACTARLCGTSRCHATLRLWCSSIFGKAKCTQWHATLPTMPTVFIFGPLARRQCNVTANSKA